MKLKAEDDHKNFDHWAYHICKVDDYFHDRESCYCYSTRNRNANACEYFDARLDKQEVHSN